MKTTHILFASALLSLIIAVAGCSRQRQEIDPIAYQKEIDSWKQNRLKRLTREDGWLTLCGLFWLKEGENKFGTDSSNSIIFPAGKSPKVAGSIQLDKGSFRLVVRKGTEVKVNDSLVTTMSLRCDTDAPGPTVMNLGSLLFYVIQRGDQYGVRVKDKENPARIHFKGLDYFPADLKWRVDARFEPYTPKKILPIATQIGTVEKDSSPGALVFELGGKTLRLDAVIEQGSENQLFIMFSDETSGKETYGPGRQLYSDLPDSTNHVVLDFNKAYNWPCVFTDFATCPIPPPQNHLPIRIEAGEKMYSGH